jgi:hypothetical protein
MDMTKITRMRFPAGIPLSAVCMTLLFSSCASVEQVEEWKPVLESEVPVSAVQIVLEPDRLVFQGKPYTDPALLAADLDSHGINCVMIRSFDKWMGGTVDVDKAARVICGMGKRRVFLDIPRNAIDSLGYDREFNWRGRSKGVGFGPV